LVLFQAHAQKHNKLQLSGRPFYYINDTGNYTDNNRGQLLDSVRGEKDDKPLSFGSQLSPQIPAFLTLSTNASTFPSIVPSNSFFSSADLIDPVWLSDSRGNNPFIFPSLLLFMVEEDVEGSSSDHDLLIPGLADLSAADELNLRSDIDDMLLLGACLDTPFLSSDDGRFTGVDGVKSISLL